MNERVLVTGANGFVGRYLCQRLVASELIPIAGVRDLSAWSELKQTVSGLNDVSSLGDLGASPDVRTSLAGASVVAHLAARVHVMKDSAHDPLQEFRKVNVYATKSLALAAAAAGVRRFIFVSTIKVHGESTSGSPLRDDSPFAPQDPYSVSKWEAEEALRAVAAETGLEVVIVRPPLVYGPGVRGNFLRLLRLVNRALPLPWPARTNCRSMIDVGNLADFLVRCVLHPKAAGQSFLVRDAEDLSTRELMTRLARLLNRPLRLVPCPEPMLRMAARMASRQDTVSRVFDSLVIDSSRVQSLLGWTPPITVDDGLAATVRWYRESFHSTGSTAS